MGYNDEIKIYNGILKGNKDILKEFYKRNYVLINDFVLKNSGTNEDSEDVFQDALIVLYQNLKSNSPVIECSIHTYFYGICKNVWYAKLRRKGKVSYCEKIDDKVVDTEILMLNKIQQNEREQLYRKHFLNLGCKCQKILNLFFKGKSMKEMAVVFNISEGNIRKKKFECKKQLMKAIEKDPLYPELVYSFDTNDIRKIVS